MAARSAHRPAAAAARPGPGRRPPGGAGRRRAGFEPALAGGRRQAPVGAEQLERVMPPVSRINFSSRARHERPATIPLLLGKLWAVYPRLWRWPPVSGVAHAVERAALVPLVGGSVFLLVTGVTNIDY